MRVVDPQGLAEGKALLPGAQWFEDAYNAAENADAIVLLTEWNEFRALDLKRLAGCMTTAAMADLRNIYSPSDAERAGFSAYCAVGRRGFGTGDWHD